MTNDTFDKLDLAEADKFQARTSTNGSEQPLYGERTLGSLVYLPDDITPNGLFAHGFLDKGCGCMVPGQTGVGKSTLTMQFALLASNGKPFCGIVPTRKLSIGIVQTEDSDNDMAEFRDKIGDFLVKDEQLTREEFEYAQENISLFPGLNSVGETFCSNLGTLLDLRREDEHPLDLIIINPLHAVFGGDLNSNAEVSCFLREQLDPVLKKRVGTFDYKGRPFDELNCAVLIVHHFCKPSSNKYPHDNGPATYLGSGAAELANWARSILAIVADKGKPGEYRIVAAKRGARLDWRTPTESSFGLESRGERTIERSIAHASTGIGGIDNGPVAPASTRKSNAVSRVAASRPRSAPTGHDGQNGNGTTSILKEAVDWLAGLPEVTLATMLRRHVVEEHGDNAASREAIKDILEQPTRFGMVLAARGRNTPRSQKKIGPRSLFTAEVRQRLAAEKYKVVQE